MQGQYALRLGSGGRQFLAAEALLQQAASEAAAHDDSQATGTRALQRPLIQRLRIDQAKADLQRRNARRGQAVRRILRHFSRDTVETDFSLPLERLQGLQ